MRLVTRIADRLVEAVAPRAAAAAACIAPEQVTVKCGCKSDLVTVKICTTGCSGQIVSCGTCHKSSIVC